MGMELKLKEDGTPLIVDGKPVFAITGKGDIPVDVPDLFNTIERLNGESAGRRKDNEDLQARLKPYEGIDPEKARVAIEFQANVDAGKLVEAGKVEELKAQIGQQIGQGWEHKLAEQDKSWQAKLAESEARNAKKDASIRNLVVLGSFLDCEFLSKETNLIPEMAHKWLGDQMEVREEDGNFVVVAKRRDGSEIFSAENPGKLATPHEAIKILILEHPDRDRILKSVPGGAGTAASSGSSTRNPWAKESYNQTEQAKLYKDNPALARQLMQQAGAAIPAGM